MTQATATATHRARSAGPSRAGATRMPRLRVVAPTQTRATRGTAFAVACLGLLVFGLVTLLLLNTARAQQSFTLNGLQAHSNNLSDQQQALQATLDKVSAPQQLALKAQSLGMAPATKIKYVQRNGHVLGVAKQGADGAPFTVETLPTTPASKAAHAAAAAASAGVAPVAPPAKKSSAHHKAGADQHSQHSTPKQKAKASAPGKKSQGTRTTGTSGHDQHGTKKSAR